MGGGAGKWEVTDNGNRFSFQGDESVPESVSGDLCTTLNTLKTSVSYTLFLYYTLLKVNFMKYELYLKS